MKSLKLTVLVAALILATVFLAKTSFAVDPPHDSIDCNACHGSGKITLSNQGLDLSSLCLDCHRAGSKGTTVAAKPANPYGNATSVIAKGKGIQHNFMGNDLNLLAKTGRPSDPRFSGSFVTGNVTCVSCHNPHTQPLTTAGQPMAA